MRIGIISDSDCCIPLAGTLVSQSVQVGLFYSLSPDSFTNQKVKAFAEQFHIPLTEEKQKDYDIYEWIQKGKFTVCFIVGYSRLIRLDKLKNLSNNLFNIHFGPLPAFRGPVPVFWQLKYGVEKLGMAIHRLNENFDEGAVVWAKEIPNLAHYNFRSVMQLFSELCVEGAFFILQRWMNKMPIAEINRRQIIPAFQKRPKLEDVSINWQQMTATDICNLTKACNPWNKGAITFWNKQELKVMDAIVLGDSKAPAGTIISYNDKMQVACSDGKSIGISMLYYMDSYQPSYNFKLLKCHVGDTFN